MCRPGQPHADHMIASTFTSTSGSICQRLLNSMATSYLIKSSSSAQTCTNKAYPALSSRPTLLRNPKRAEMKSCSSPYFVSTCVNCFSDVQTGPGQASAQGICHPSNRSSENCWELLPGAHWWHTTTSIDPVQTDSHHHHHGHHRRVLYAQQTADTQLYISLGG
ncbi:uncharacterized protein LOC124350092 [Daphnia pulicaria]|uniref:uncharacterized protein LOC124350092 n=1 Tax=Daphnia pulicaria TaxID=35523 RepID=UPI001EEB518A|nr:uncharacterized protein LOC124350092 [Daphnia pulicaria]